MAPILSRLSSDFGFGKRTAAAVPFSATGGNVDGLAPGNGYKYHTFTSPGTFTANEALTIEVVAVGGGGGGSGGVGGGGGGGGAVIYNASVSVDVGPHPVTVGAAGTGDSPGTRAAGGNGGSTIFSSITAPGGTGGPSLQDSGNSNGNGGGYGGPGGSPGGGNGGAGPQPFRDGAGNPGSDGTLVPTGFDAPLYGVPALAPLNRYFGGGGGGGYWDGPSNGYGNGGLGGGGRGGGESPNAGVNGTTNSGGGGGGGTDPGEGPNPPAAGGAGGSGIVIIRYLA